MLHAGALDSIHLRRWAELTGDLGHQVSIAGHLRAGFAAAVDASAQVHVSPQLRWASTRHAQRTGRRRDVMFASLPNPAVEVPMLAAWLRRLVGRLRPDLIHAHWLPHWGAAAALAGGPPLVAGAWGSDIYDLRGVRRWLAGLTLARAEFVVAPSPHAAGALSSRSGRAGRVFHLEQGLDLDAFRPPSPEEREAARARLGVADGPAVLSFRTSAPVYRLPLVVEAFRRLLAQRPDARLLMVHGALPLDNATAAVLAGLGDSVRVLGEASPEEMRTCFHAADVGVSVPSSDGSPNSVWECLASGTPVVCSDLPQLRERFSPGEGAVFATSDSGAVAHALEGVVADSARAHGLGAAGRTWCEANVDRRDSMPRLDALYRGAVRDRACARAGSRPGARA